MFTGLIEALCPVSKIQNSGGSMRITVELDSMAKDCVVGESTAINGVCLTVTEFTGSQATFDVSPETLNKSTLANLSPQTLVNIERAMKADGRFGGHFVQGHVDGIARIEKIDRDGNFWTFRFSATAELLDQMVKKGSVAIDGISLTIAQIDERGFTVAVIPETLNKTNLQNAKAGDQVNIETDLVVKIIKKQLQNVLPQQVKLTIDKLQEMGF
jgi:riboflavin synthase